MLPLARQQFRLGYWHLSTYVLQLRQLRLFLNQHTKPCALSGLCCTHLQFMSLAVVDAMRLVQHVLGMVCVHRAGLKKSHTQ